ncbi:MAG: DUF58 domain-containing protein [Treponema sp.]|nr:DUF58 domain-containing protein [Treponema sp.]
MKDAFKRLPVTLPGFAVFTFALVTLVRSLAARNAHEIVLSLAAVLLLAALWLTGKWALRRLATLEPVWNIPVPVSAASTEQWLVTCPAENIPRFFRLHFRVRGRFFPQGSSEGCPVFAEASMAAQGAARLDLAFPLGGFFQGSTSCRLRDMFGFFSFPCGTERERTLNIRSAPCQAIPLRIDAQSGAEDRRNKNANDEERYYMREYAPGDRFRDINWKSSERINTLITRISPDNQEKITRIEIHFRNYGPGLSGKKRGAKAGMADLWLLDRAKARLAWFLRKAKEEKSSYVFHVRSAGTSWDLDADEDIQAFLEELCAIPFFPPQNESSVLPQTEGELYIFSTACDTALPAFLLTQQGRPYSLFLAQNTPGGKNTADKKPDVENLYLRDFFSGTFAPLPRWFPQGRRQLLNVSGGRMMVDYAETRL